MPDFSPAAGQYLSRLTSELRGVREPLRGDIWAGVAEELDGLPDSDARNRIAELGDPAFIAREALTAGGAEQPADTRPAGYRAVPERDVPIDHSRGWAITGAVALGVGGFVVPVAGWILGVALVTASPLWTRRVKAIAILAPVLIVVVAAFVTNAIGAAFDPSESTNLLVPLGHGYVLTSVIGVGLLNVGAMVWLLRRLGGRRP